MKSLTRGFSVLIILAIFSQACGTFGKITARYPSDVSTEMQASFDSAESLYRAKKFPQALLRYQNYITQYTYNKLTDEALYKSGKIAILQSQFDMAKSNFDKLMTQTPDSDYKAKAGLMVGFVDYKLEQYNDCFSAVSKVDEKDLTDKLQLQLYSLEYLCGKRASASREQTDLPLLKLANLYQGGQNTELSQITADGVMSVGETNQAIDSFVVSPLTVSQIPSWASSFPKSYARGFLDYKLGKIYFEAGQTQKAREALSRFVKNNPQNSYLDSGNKLLQQLGGAVSVEDQSGTGIKVGVLLPLSGTQRGFGEATLRGINCAAGRDAACGNLMPGFKRVDLIIRDSGSTNEEVQAAFDQLVKEDVVAVIGPMSGNLASSAVERAEASNTVVLPITQKSGLMTAGKYVFQMGYPVVNQVHDLVQKALSRGLRKVAILSPKSSFGQEVTQMFVTEAANQGMSITSKVTYDPSNMAMVGTSLVMIKTSKQKPDAIFIPDSYRAIPALAAGLVESELGGIPLIGTNAWNDAVLPKDSFSAFPGSFFVDVFFDGDVAHPLTKRFVQAFKSAYDHSPTSIEAFGFEALNVINTAISSAGSDRSSKIRDALSDLTGFEGVTGIKSFEAGVAPRVDPYVITITSDGFVPLN